ncbi:two-component sensor histidine kinase [Streptomyces nojiriensis]|uniref:histidine kinase n=1 Tax=Streptomyces nojiriensis TaxID=66374 RepID=A0ABQ3SPV3_9ACTN|nr:histidine kinase [Streptomyces nojiriensis]QTI43675.1 Sensor histidine kinase DesK [Streptomyces nojiriensis]GGR82789.1 two-component sensor histidine kinase [Streptomyces nojiriensis]GHI70141.1 two-component sensor histidine kinase [Streptomyces nojiriensis]
MRRIHRTRRDWAADLALFLFAACFAAVSSQSIPVAESLGPGWRAADQVAGGLGCAAVLLRRRAPVRLAVVLLLAGSVAHYLTGPAMVAVFTVAATRPWKATAWVAALVFGPLPLFLWQLPDMSEERAGSAVTYFALIAGAIGWGLFRRSRQQLIASLRERAELAEADAESRAERARMEAREEIAREMHDVLGHRLSLLSLHAGALEFNPGAPRAEIERAAGVMRESAHLALHDLREVIGVLRAGPGTRTGAGPAEGGERPQPELADLPRLVAEARAAGGRIELAGPPDGAVPPPLVGRTAYRIVQEALTNVRKHAPGATADVRVTGGPGDGLTVEVDNTPPPGPDPVRGTVPGPTEGGGQGLIGLAERARLAGGELTALPAGGGFRVRAWLPWQG